MEEEKRNRRKSERLPLRKRNYIREWREFRGYGSQGALAEVVGIARATISRIESGHLQYRQWHLDKIALVLKCEPAELLGVNPYNNTAIIQIFDGLSPRRKRAVLKAIKEITD